MPAFVWTKQMAVAFCQGPLSMADAAALIQEAALHVKCWGTCPCVHLEQVTYQVAACLGTLDKSTGAFAPELVLAAWGCADVLYLAG